MIGGGSDRQGAVWIENKPGPAAAEAFGGCCLEGLLKVCKGAEGFVDGVCDGAGGRAARVGGHHLPEERVIDVAANIIDEALSDVFRSLVEVLDEFFGRVAGQFGVGFQKAVGIIHISLMVLVVVDAHGFRVDVGFQRFVGIGERGEGVGARRSGGLGERRKREDEGREDREERLHGWEYRSEVHSRKGKFHSFGELPGRFAMGRGVRGRSLGSQMRNEAPVPGLL